ncbi:MAG: membrane or secreted protein [Planctomycetes bacterium]|nr:membrane or secreted protein [Planctomycetota bacterium]
MLHTGCQSSKYSKPYGFGTIDNQKSRAADFDPYPLNDIGPAVVGGRPPGFFNPLPEPKRNELQAQQRNAWTGYSR